MPSHTEFEAKARELVSEAMGRGGDLWERISPATLSTLIRAVATDLRDEADIATRLAGDAS